MPFSIGPMELVVVLVIALVVLGPKRLPDAGKAIGKGMREFKGAIGGSTADEPDDDLAPPARPVPVAAARPVD